MAKKGMRTFSASYKKPTKKRSSGYIKDRDGYLAVVGVDAEDMPQYRRVPELPEAMLSQKIDDRTYGELPKVTMVAHYKSIKRALSFATDWMDNISREEPGKELNYPVWIRYIKGKDRFGVYKLNKEYPCCA